MTDDPAFARVRDAALGHKRRSPLHDWLWTHRDGIAELVAEARSQHRTLDYAGMVAALPDEIRDGRGQRPSPETLRQTIWKVLTECGKMPPRKVSAAPAGPTGVQFLSAPGVRPNQPAAKPPADDAAARTINDALRRSRAIGTEG